VLALLVTVVAAFPFTETVASASVSRAASCTALPQTDSQEAPAQVPSRNLAPRIKLIALVPREVAFGEPIASVIVIDPAIAIVERKGDRSVLITGLMTGDTILIISGKTSRITYALDVEHPQALRRPRNSGDRVERVESYSGSDSIYFTAGSNGAPSLLRESFEYRQKLPNELTLRMSGELFRFFGGGDRALTAAPVTSFGANRLKLGLDSPTIKLDVLDSALEFSQLGFSGLLLRGPHFVSTRESRGHGLELFAGNASPRLTLFNQGEGRVAGAIMPIIKRKSLRVRSGVFYIAPLRRLDIPANAVGTRGGPNGGPNGGMVLHTDARYTPDDRTTLEGEAAYANGGLSWRGKLDLRRGAFNFLGELSNLDRHSPMTAIGAQSGARKTSSFNLQWQPDTSFSASAGYNRTTTVPLEGSSRVQLNSTGLLVSTNFRPTLSANLGFSIDQQVIDAPASTLGAFLFNLQTRTAVVKYDQRIASHWANNLEARLVLSREAKTDAQINHGLILREQLRLGWVGGSITGFVNYSSNTPSLESLIIRNPALLPVEFQAAFAMEPVRFLLTNRDVLPLLLNGVQLPLTQNTESGVRLQSSSSRLNFTSEIVYSVGKFIATDQRTLLTSLSVDFRLDAANSVQVNAARAFAFSGTGAHTSLTVGYVHHFGTGSGGGFQFSRLLGLDRGHIQGRVFGDLNGNGKEDPGENGIAGMTVRMDGKQTVVTDSRGDFTFGSLEPGDFDVSLISDDLGVKLRASNATQQHVSLSARHTVNLSFGLTNSGFAAGRVFNDLLLTAEQAAGDAPGLPGVKITLRLAEAMADSKPLIQTVDGDGLYEFRNLPPGKYVLGIDTATLPADFRVPAQTTWPITVSPLQGAYLDIPLAAQRAVTGTVYMDFDGDGKFSPETDTPIPGAYVRIGQAEAITDRTGAYILRNIAAGQAEIRATTTRGYASRSIEIELPAAPSILRDINLAVSKRVPGN
jgi:hypothetical protein